MNLALIRLTRGLNGKLGQVILVSVLLCACAPQERVRTADSAPVRANEAPAIAVASTPTTTPTTTPAPASAPVAFVDVTSLLRVDRSRQIVEMKAVAVLDTGFLEQLVCQHGTREHESLFAFAGLASEVHAALLLAGFVPGAPGRWTEIVDQHGIEQNGGVEIVATTIAGIAPNGSPVEITVRLPDGTERAITDFIREAPLGKGASAPPPNRFVFGGSRFHTDLRTGRERYVADGSGSIVGLVTFGDETIGCLDVIPDQASAAAPTWEVFTERMPKPGTTVILRLSLPNQPKGPDGAINATDPSR